MSDNITGISIVNPSYPVRRVRPPDGEEKSGKHRERTPPKESDPDPEVDDPEDNAVIDEYI